MNLVILNSLESLKEFTADTIIVVLQQSTPTTIFLVRSISQC